MSYSIILARHPEDRANTEIKDEPYVNSCLPCLIRWPTKATLGRGTRWIQRTWGHKWTILQNRPLPLRPVGVCLAHAGKRITMSISWLGSIWRKPRQNGSKHTITLHSLGNSILIFQTDHLLLLFSASPASSYIVTEGVRPISFHVQKPGKQKSTELYHVNLVQTVTCFLHSQNCLSISGAQIRNMKVSPDIRCRTLHCILHHHHHLDK